MPTATPRHRRAAHNSLHGVGAGAQSLEPRRRTDLPRPALPSCLDSPGALGRLTRSEPVRSCNGRARLHRRSISSVRLARESVWGWYSEFAVYDISPDATPPSAASVGTVCYAAQPANLPLPCGTSAARRARTDFPRRFPHRDTWHQAHGDRQASSGGPVRSVTFLLGP